MCFSAGASFGASAVLGGIGIVAIAKAKTTPQRLFAVIPFLFSFQQLSEGMLWLSVTHDALHSWQPFFIYTFLFFAMMVWPVWVPLTILLLEKNKSRRKILKWMTGAGIIVAIGVAVVLISCNIRVVPTHHHLHYRFDLSPDGKKLIVIFSLLYILATIVSPFFSTNKRMKWLGVGFLISYLVAVTFFQGYVVSVWCFLAALLSFVVLWILSEERKL
ncbi:MAG: DUF6629 family protein [Chitinophagaceae bacterium]